MQHTLEVFLSGTNVSLKAGDPSITITGLTADSREVKPGYLFVAVEGITTDGHQFIETAVAAGASAVLTKVDYTFTHQKVAHLTSADTQHALGYLASTFYEFPSQELDLVGITGTNGKTTVATLCYDLFTALGYKCGLIGTVELRIADQIEQATHTTPDAIAVQRLLRRMADAGCGYVFMEVSSHALAQQRTNGCQFAGAAFTNISHDHLDYHGDMKSYIAAKKLLFDGLDSTAFALVNADDKRGAVMLQNCNARPKTYALQRLAAYKGKILDDDLRGLHLHVDGQEVHTLLAGAFNAYNFLAAYGIGVELGQDKEEVLSRLSALRGAAGRLEVVAVAKSKVTGIVDYAHTPDALQNVLETLQTGRRAGNKLITVFGCGGDRDRTKRPLMGQIAVLMSDTVIVTDDNPRTENADDIRKQIVADLSEQDRARVLEISARESAIKTAVQLAANEDVILIAGKGHETYQEINGERHDFDDKAILLTSLRAAVAR